jgi:type II secretory pathway pseudopilin PulG
MNIFDVIMNKKKKSPVNRLRGFSLGEILVVVTIIILLSFIVIMAYRNQLGKAHDATRKEHLNAFKIAFEDYYNDNNCYPSQEMWDGCVCGGNCLSPFMDTFLCDPITKQKYYYYPFVNDSGVSDPCLGYRLYTKLDNTGDPDIARVGCGPNKGCGDGILASYNYGITLPGPLTDPSFVPDVIPLASTTTPTPIPGSNFCLGDGTTNCNVKSGCAPDYDKRPCNLVLIENFGCRGFVDANECSALCRSDYNTYKCAATETLNCRTWRSPQCQ